MTVSASATVSGVTRTDTKAVTIRNTDTKATYTLDLNAVNGHIAASPDLNSYEAGTEVRLTAYPDDNYVRSHWSGDASGAERSVYLTMTGNKSVTAHFALDTRTADVTVNIEPPSAGDDGAGFRIAGEGSSLNNWQPPGETVSNRKAGVHRIWFKDIPGWITPEDIEIEVAGGLPIEVTGSYLEVPGTVQVTLNPSAAAGAGARWRIDGGLWQEAGVTLPSVTPGSHSIEFRALEGWTTPPAQTIEVARGAAVTVSGSYGPPAGFPVISSISPKTGPISGGTQVTIDGVNFSPESTVAFNGIPAAAISVESSNRILATTPPRASYGTVPVTVDSGGLQAVAANGFSYLEPLGSNMELAGQIGGSFLSVAVQGNLAYIGEGTSLVILDITNPATPVERGRLALPNSVVDIEVDGGFAYLATGSSGLFVVDVSTPTAPLVTGFYDTPGVTQDLALGDGVVYAADGLAGLQLIDISVPSSPTLAGTHATPGAASRVQTGDIGGQRIVCIGGADEGVRVVDASNHAELVELAYIPPPTTDGVRDLRLLGSTLYAAFPYAVRIIDLASPGNPQVRSTFSTVANCLDVANGRAYVCDGPLYVLNVSNPNSPSEISNFEVRYYPERIRVSGQYAFIAFGREGFKIINISNPASPTLATTIKGVGSVNGVRLRGTLALTGNADSGISTVDVANAANPREQGRTGSGPVSHIEISGNTAVLVDSSFRTVKTLDITSPQSPVERASYTQINGLDVALVGTTPVVTGFTRSSPFVPVLDVLNVSNPSSPQRIGFCQLSSSIGRANGISTAGSWGFVITNTGNLHIVNFAVPTAPALTSSLTLGGDLRDVAVSSDGTHVYVADSAQGVRIIDASSKTLPLLVASFDPPQSSEATNGVHVSGDRLVVTDSSFVYVYDITDREAPVQVAYYDLPRVSISGSKIDVAGDFVYVAAGSSGLMVLKIGDIEKPIVTIGAPTSNASYNTSEGSVAISGTASDNRLVTRVIWENEQGGGGVAEGTGNWMVPQVQLVAGLNRITVRAEDADGNVGSDVLEVVATMPDTQAPLVVITGPTTDNEHVTVSELATLVGSVSDDRLVGSVTWTTSSGLTGPATLVGQTWTVEDIPLETGPNVIMVTAADIAGNTFSDAITILRSQPDFSKPAITIGFPTTEANYSTRSGHLNVSGVASDDGELVSVAWSSNRGPSGPAEGTATWAVNGIILEPGVNILTVTATDASGKIEEDSISVTYTPYDSDADGLADDWEMQHFSALNVAGLETDTGSTGYSDFLKQALGLDPGNHDPEALPRVVTGGQAGGVGPVFKYRRPIAPGPLQYTIGVSEDLGVWDWSESQIEQVGVPTPTGDGFTEEVTLRLVAAPGEEHASAFFRISVLAAAGE